MAQGDLAIAQRRAELFLQRLIIDLQRLFIRPRGRRCCIFRLLENLICRDISDLPETPIARLEGLDVWIVDALRYTPHPSHFSVAEALRWIERLKPRRAILTHMTSDLDYAKLAAELPPVVEPAYDGMVIEVPG